MSRRTTTVRDDLIAGRDVRPRDVARDKNLAPGVIYDAIRAGEIRAVRIGRTWSIPNAEGRRLFDMEAAKAAA